MHYSLACDRDLLYYLHFIGPNNIGSSAYREGIRCAVGEDEEEILVEDNGASLLQRYNNDNNRCTLLGDVRSVLYIYNCLCLLKELEITIIWDERVFAAASLIGLSEHISVFLTISSFTIVSRAAVDLDIITIMNVFFIFWKKKKTSFINDRERILSSILHEQRNKGTEIVYVRQFFFLGPKKMAALRYVMNNTTAVQYKYHTSFRWTRYIQVQNINW
ncbi:hypothetical protein ACJX0J_035947, partial [Zea mays]